VTGEVEKWRRAAGRTLAEVSVGALPPRLRRSRSLPGAGARELWRAAGIAVGPERRHLDDGGVSERGWPERSSPRRWPPSFVDGRQSRRESEGDAPAGLVSTHRAPRH
jgi:hypothetical protein